MQKTRFKQLANLKKIGKHNKMQPKSPRFKSIQSTKTKYPTQQPTLRSAPLGVYLGEFDSSIIHRVFVNMPYKTTTGRKWSRVPFVQYVLCNVPVLVKDQGFKLFFEESNRHNTGILVAYGIRYRCLMSQLPPCLFAKQRESWRLGNSFVSFMVERSVDSGVIRHSNNWVAFFSAEILDTNQANQWFLKE